MFLLLTRYLRPYGRQILVLCILLLLTLALELINPRLISTFIDAAMTGQPLNELTLLAAAFLGIAISVQFLSLGNVYIATNLGMLASNRLRADLMLHCLQLDPAFHNDHTPGELIERIDGDVNTLANFFSQFIVALFSNGLLLVGILLILFTIDWRVGAILTVLAIVTIAAIMRLRIIGVPRWEAERQTQASLYGFIEERLSGTEDIRSNGATDYVLRRLYEHERRVLYTGFPAWALGIGTFATTIVMMALMLAVGLGIGVNLYETGAASLGVVYLIVTYITQLFRPIEQIARQFQDLQQASGGIERVRKLLAQQSAIVQAADAQNLPAGALSVEFENVSFDYHAALRTIHAISFSLPAGRVLGLLGRTGSGKTTLTRLLFRLYDPTTGAIRLGGVGLPQTQLADLRRNVGMVTQDIQLFHASVRDNLTFFDATIADERIVQVLTELGLMDWYATLPDGLNTRIAAGGVGLSAGEAQLLAFARVFLRDPGLVILDEASSRLDPATEQRLERAIDKLLAGRTAIIIAHRLGTVHRADDILILDSGHIAEFGPRETLANDPTSRFAQLLKTGLEMQER